MSKAGASSVQRSGKGSRASADRRRSDRAPFVVRVDYGTVDAFFSEFTADVNEGGLFIETDNPQPPGSAVVLQFRIPGSDQPIKVRGRVVWTSEQRPSESPGMGIEFENLDVRARARIDEAVRRLRSESDPQRLRAPSERDVILRRRIAAAGRSATRRLPGRPRGRRCPAQGPVRAVRGTGRSAPRSRWCAASGLPCSPTRAS